MCHAKKGRRKGNFREYETENKERVRQSLNKSRKMV